MLRSRDAEVGDTGLVSRHEHIGGLEVAVHDAGGVRGCEPVARLAEELQRFAPGAVPLEPLLERSSVDEVHDEEHVLRGTPNVVNRDEVRMGELRHHLRLATQTV